MLVSHTTGLVSFEIADDSPLALQITKRDLVANATATLAAYPQYKGCHDGDEWTLIRVNRTVKTKMGTAFVKGEIALARRRDEDMKRVLDGEDGWTAWSVSNGVHTSLPIRYAEEVTA